MNRAIGILAWHGVVLRRGIRLGAAAHGTPPAAIRGRQTTAPIPRRRRRAPGRDLAALDRAPHGATAARPCGRPAGAAAASGPRLSAPPADPATAPKSAAKTDRLELGTATVTGDREQPKVMYIVPWKRSDIGDLAGKPMNSLVDEILAPVDRDVFKREVVYYGAVQAEASQNGAPPKP